MMLTSMTVRGNVETPEQNIKREIAYQPPPRKTTVQGKREVKMGRISDVNCQITFLGLNTASVVGSGDDIGGAIFNMKECHQV
uniref:Uncharacterized protein n=1 Tax=Arion vulgaris TaxID=1028688 RepID=A0A0B7BII2_9EUPU